MKNRILVPVDGSELSLSALDRAADLARALDSDLIVAYVVDLAKAASISFGDPQCVSGCVDALREEGESILRTATQRAGPLCSHVESRLVQGNPAEEIAGLASALRAGWIVMGSHGRTGLSHLLMGSVAEGVLHRSSVPVMIVPVERVLAKVRKGETAKIAAG